MRIKVLVKGCFRHEEKKKREGERETEGNRTIWAKRDERASGEELLIVWHTDPLKINSNSWYRGVTAIYPSSLIPLALARRCHSPGGCALSAPSLIHIIASEASFRPALSYSFASERRLCRLALWNE